MSADEFETIARLFAPLAMHPGARGLRDDAAVLDVSGKLVLTTDALVEGVHFLADAPIETAAQKALRVNLSDLAAKGARPIGVLVSLLWPNGRSASEIDAFARGLGEDLKRFDVALLGGDTTSTPGPLAISVTAIGEAGARAPARADAAVGHDLWVTGSIGDAFLGWQLQVSGGRIRGEPGARDREYLIARYRTPAPRLGLADAVGAFAGASIDVSDGLIADAGKIAAASGVRVCMEAEAIPISPPARRHVLTLEDLVTAGDDYEILFTAALAQRAALASAAAAAGVPLSRIGRIEAGAGVLLLDANGRAIALAGGGHAHRLGSATKGKE